MNPVKVLIIVVAVVLVHGVIISTCVPSCGKTPGKTEPKDEIVQGGGGVEAPVTPGEGGKGGADVSPKPQVSDSPKPKQPADTRPATPGPGAQGAYYKGFFKVAERPLPAKLNSAVSEARSGLVIDLNTNTILWQKNADKSYPIASLTKLLTSVMLMEHLEATPGGSLKTKVTVTSSDRAYFKRNSINGVYLDTNESYSLDEYLMCMIVGSANDCAYVVGRYLSGGDGDAFPAMMNRRAKELGLAGMNFNNANGLPIKNGSTRRENTGSALEVAYLALRAMKYPEIMKWAKTTHGRIRADKKNPFDVNSTNKLLRGRVNGVNGLKTGFTDGAGYCIVVTCERDGRKRMVLLMGVGGSDRGKRRDEIARLLLEWSYES